MAEQNKEKEKKKVDAKDAPEAAAAAPEQQKEGAETKRAKVTRMVPSGIAYIHATFNNTKVTYTDLHGNVLCWHSAGKAGFKGSKKSTVYVAQLVATEATKKAQLLGMKECEVRINGPGAGREAAVRGIAAAGMDISSLQDVTPVPHNGCRPPKRRRV